ncbi:hypothetical protein, partial [Streptomyces stramineus]|uniref:hypothetical protein n=1 Tax=Streptomyces stramineus TaxID=173861 RepID=UPI0031D8A25C
LCAGRPGRPRRGRRAGRRHGRLREHGRLGVDATGRRHGRLVDGGGLGAAPRRRRPETTLRLGTLRGLLRVVRLLGIVGLL